MSRTTYGTTASLFRSRHELHPQLNLPPTTSTPYVDNFANHYSIHVVHPVILSQVPVIFSQVHCHQLSAQLRSKTHLLPSFATISTAMEPTSQSSLLLCRPIRLPVFWSGTIDGVLMQDRKPLTQLNTNLRRISRNILGKQT